MDVRVLVAYATKHGATAEIAERIGEVLRQADLQADVKRAQDVTDLTPYGAVVLGSGVYIGKWQGEAAKFLEANEKALAGLPVWLFSSGPTGEGDAVELTKGWSFPEAQQEVADRIGPRDIALFSGLLDPKKLSLMERLIIKGVKAPMGDFRDWGAVTVWAEGIAGELKKGD